MNRLPRSIPLAFLLTTVTMASASELLYQPVNPSFGGNPNYGAYLLNSAKAQNQFDDPDAPSRKELTPTEEFNQRLQRSLLSRMTSIISRSVIGDNGAINPGNFETTDFLISITDLGGGQMNITTTDKVTGDQTSIVIETGL